MYRETDLYPLSLILLSKLSFSLSVKRIPRNKVFFSYLVVFIVVMFWKEFWVFPQRTITDIFCNGFISRGFQSFFELNVFFFGEAYGVTPRSVFFFFHDSMSFYCVMWSLRNFPKTNYRTEKFPRSGVVRDAHPHLQNAVFFLWKRYVVTVFFFVFFHVFFFLFRGKNVNVPRGFCRGFQALHGVNSGGVRKNSSKGATWELPVLRVPSRKTRSEMPDFGRFVFGSSSKTHLAFYIRTVFEDFSLGEFTGQM